MKLNRCTQIILYCLQKDGFVSLDELSKELLVSPATIRSDLPLVEEEIKAYNLSLVRKRGVGYQITGSFTDKSYAYQHFIKKRDHDKDDDDLVYNLLLALIKNANKFIRIRDLANDLYVSESTVQKKILEIKKIIDIEDVQIESVKNKGIRLVCSESAIRMLYYQLMKRNKAVESKSNEDIKSQVLELLHIQPDFIFNEIKKCECSLNQSFSDEAVNSLAIHIAIAVRRINDGKTVPHQEFVNTDRYKHEYEAAKKLCSAVEKYYNISFNEDEIYYVFLHLISTKILKDDSIISNPNNNNEYDKASEIAKNIVNLVSNIKQIDIEKKYIDNLIIHLRPTINRIEYNMKLTNPLLDEIKKKYPEAYGIAWMCNPIFLRTIHKEMSEDEAAFIAIHIQTMIESKLNYIKAVLVCSSGIGISQLLATQIEKHINKIKIVGIESIDSFKEKKYDAHCVISTFPINTKLPLIIVSPILSDYDIQHINDFIFKNSIDNRSRHLPIITFINQDYCSQAELIRGISKSLEESGYVNSDFADSVFDRESINSTAIGMETALPHADFKTINKTCLAIVTLKRKILWGSDKVDLVIFSIIRKDDVAFVTPELRDIYRKLYSKENHQRFINAEKHEEILSILKE